MKHFFFLIVLLAAILVTGPAVAGTEHNLSGFAWADTVGWISFNCTNVTGECSRSDYGVNVDPTTGAFSGHAWSDNVGWISFNDLSADAGKPASYSAPQVQGTNVTGFTKNVTGFAKIRSLDNGGWLRFENATYNTTTRQFAGWMWNGNGNDDRTGIGWVELRSVVRAAPPNDKPDKPVTKSPKDNVDIGTFDPAMTVHSVVFKWSDFDDSDPGDTQSAYRITLTPVVGTLSGSDPSRCVIDSSTATLTCTIERPGSEFAYASVYGYPALRYGTPYTWHVEVRDAQNVWSAPSLDATFRTPFHALPDTQFTFAPTTPRENDVVQFTDTSRVFESGDPIQFWKWDFVGDGSAILENPDAGDASKTEGEVTIADYYRNPTYRYTQKGTYNVCLTITDKDGYATKKCNPLTVGAKQALPIWQRIIPF